MEVEAEAPNRRPMSLEKGPGREVHPRRGGVGTSPEGVVVGRDCLVWETCVVAEEGEAEEAIDLGNAEGAEEVGQLRSKSRTCWAVVVPPWGSLEADMTLAAAAAAVGDIAVDLAAQSLLEVHNPLLVRSG